MLKERIKNAPVGRDGHNLEVLCHMLDDDVRNTLETGYLSWKAVYALPWPSYLDFCKYMVERIEGGRTRHNRGEYILLQPMEEGINPMAVLTLSLVSDLLLDADHNAQYRISKFLLFGGGGFWHIFPDEQSAEIYSDVINDPLGLFGLWAKIWRISAQHSARRRVDNYNQSDYMINEAKVTAEIEAESVANIKAGMARLFGGSEYWAGVHFDPMLLALRRAQNWKLQLFFAMAEREDYDNGFQLPCFDLTKPLFFPIAWRPWAPYNGQYQ